MLQIHGRFFLNCCWECMYVYKYNLFGLYTDTPTYVFRADHLVLDNYLVCSSPENAIAPTLISP